MSDYLGFLVAAFFDLQRERLEIIRLILSGLTMTFCLFLIAQRSESLHHITSYHHAKKNTAENGRIFFVPIGAIIDCNF